MHQKSKIMMTVVEYTLKTRFFTILDFPVMYVLLGGFQSSTQAASYCL